MTGNVVIDLAISLVGIAMLVGLAQLIFGTRRATLSLETARERLSFDEPDFQPTDWLIDADEEVALAMNGRGETAVVRVLGDGFVVRRLAQGAVSCAHLGKGLMLGAPDHTFGDVSIAAGSEAEAAKWARHFGDREGIVG